MNAADLAAALEGHPSGSGWSARCPAHEDSNPSLSINEGRDGRLLLKCFAGCTFDSITAAIRERGLSIGERPGLTIEELALEKQLPVELLQAAGWREGSYNNKPCIEIPYLDRQRRVVAVQYRIGLTGENRFRFRKGDKAKQLYGVEHLRPQELTLLVEGSTDVITARLHKFNCIGVSSADGWSDAFAPIFKDCDVIFVVIEPDQGGKQLYAACAQSRLRDKFRIVRLPEGIKDLNALHCADPTQFGDRLHAAMLKAEPIESRVVMVTADAVEIKPLEWLVAEVFALAKVSLLAGDPGLGKSLLTNDLMAAVTTGSRHPWRDVNVGEVILLSAEDDAADTIVPRLKAAGANLSRVHVLTAVKHYNRETGEASEHHFSLVDDVTVLDEVLRQRGGRIRLIVIDPISAYLGSVDSHVNAQVRAALAPLSALAGKHRVAVVIVSHLNKGGGVGSGSALYRVSGSLAFTAAARAAFAVAQDDADPERRLFLPLKHNLAKMSDGFAYRVVERDGVPVLEWEQGRVAVTAAEALTSTKEKRDTAVEEWLTERLSSGQKFATTMWPEAEQRGFSENRVKAARKRLGVLHTREKREDGSSGWVWALPGQPARSPARPSRPLGPLGPLEAKQEVQEVQEGQEVHQERKKTSSLSPSRIAEINRELEEAGCGL